MATDLTGLSAEELVLQAAQSVLNASVGSKQDAIAELLRRLREGQEAQTVLRAWQEAFGTTQLTHALAKLKNPPEGD